MKAPRRWLDERNESPHTALLRAAMNEPLPARALQRAGQRLGASAAVLSASAQAIAGQGLTMSAGTQAAAAGTQAAAASATVGTTLLFTLGKAMTVGLGIGGLLVGTAHWTSLGRPMTTATTATTATTPSVAAAERGRAAQSIGTTSQRSVVDHEPSRLEPIPAPNESSAQLGTKVTVTDASSASASPRNGAGSSGLAVLPSSLHEPQSRRLVASTALARFADEPDAPIASSAKAAPPSEPIAPTSPNPLRSSLAQEVRALDSIRDALRAGEARRALDELNRAEREHVFLRLNREAAVLRVQ
ncbi:MAG TPA: hypothetical protein VIV60_10465, partial [Polyangiaceae bacterium]